MTQTGSSAPSYQALRVIVALVMREMTTRYGKSTGGYIWALIEPVGMIAVLSIAFSQFLRTPPIGDSFLFFYATGYLPFYMYGTLAREVSSAVQRNRSLLHFPMVTPLDAVIARTILSVITVILIVMIVFFGTYLIVGEPSRIDMAPLILSFTLSAMLGTGIGTLNAVIFTFIPVWTSIWKIINRPLFIISGIFYTFESMPTEVQELLWWNPLVHVIGLCRVAMFSIYDGHYISIGYVLAISFGTFIPGAYLLQRHKTRMLEGD